MARKYLPDTRAGKTHKFVVGGTEGYMTVGMYLDGQPGEIFIQISKAGSNIKGLINGVAVLTSIALQNGVTLASMIDKFEGTSFEPCGYTNNPTIPYASSILDYVFRWLRAEFLDTKGLELK